MSVRRLLGCQALRSVRVTGTQPSLYKLAPFHTARSLWNEKKPTEEVKVVADAAKAVTESKQASVTEATNTDSSNEPVEFVKPVPYKNADGITVYPPDYLHGSFHWVFERAVSISLLPLLTYPCAFGSHPMVDFALGFILPIHCHMGFGAMIQDYFPKRKFPRANRASVIGLRLATAGAMYGCYELNTNDIGLTETVIKLWTA
ncbi:CybS-domain-containing protein [Basidiobolus meristosporus CBS 931.73]|uniref:Succinate dehydrogenase [ubiquinone] cytochrome b small subunit n=1 Tax=Basidiobolus meristosporus CBS 931.73 TaxID=1314790 RepID=A0A1Y1VRU2_9FUNG|nr:CybS-domain-containing protein [Basidiobolus meristosporus CBS 931.73]ORY04061.1 CybS-domain-containing protein [Basidiobolus meristosporus CBS 931.73]|eukprot:ORX64000.1 CybS-domain-containing protein [Basidiobolus meristosporus CBS 931.73]